MTRPITAPDVTTAMRSLWQPTEKQFQALVLDLAGKMGWSCYHTFDSRRSQAGFPDVVMVKPPRLIFLELKVGKHQATDAQIAWLDLIGQCGAEAYVMRSTGDQTRDAMGIADLLARKPAKAAA